MSNAVIQRVEEWAFEAAEAYELVVFDVHMAPGWTIQVFIDRIDDTGAQKGVSVDECVLVSRYMEALLDADEDVPEKYRIEVSSPGVERKVTKWRQLALVLGRTMRVVLHEAQNGDDVFEGKVLSAADGAVELEFEDKKISVQWDNVAKAKLTYDFSGV